MDARTLVVLLVTCIILMFLICGIAVTLATRRTSITLMSFAGACVFLSIDLAAAGDPMFGQDPTKKYSMPTLVGVTDLTVIAPTILAIILVVGTFVCLRRERTRPTDSPAGSGQ